MAKPPAANDESFYYAPGAAGSPVDFAPGRSDEDPWIVLWSPGRRAQSLHLAHFTRSGEFVEERLFAVTPGWPETQAVWRHALVSDLGLVHSDVDEGDLGTRDLRTIQVYDLDGRRLAEAPVRNGKLIGLTRDAEAVLLSDDEVDGPQVRLVDPFSGRQSVAISWPSRGGVRTDRGGLPRRLPYRSPHRRGELLPGAKSLRRRRRAPLHSGRRAGRESSHTGVEWVLRGGVHPRRMAVHRLQRTRRPMVGLWAPRRVAARGRGEGRGRAGDGGAYASLSPGRRLVVLEPGGEVAGPFALEPPPAGMTWAERAALRDDAGAGPPSGPEVWATYLSTASAAGGEPWNRARRLALGSPAEATDGAIAAAEQWCWVGPPGELLRDLLDRDPAGVGEVITRHLEATGGDGNDISTEVLARLLVEHWRRPSPRFAILLQDHAPHYSNLGSWAQKAYAEPQHGMAPAERFPAPPSLVERHLADLDVPGGDGPDSDSARFFLAQFEHTAAGSSRRGSPTRRSPRGRTLER